MQKNCSRCFQKFGITVKKHSQMLIIIMMFIKTHLDAQYANSYLVTVTIKQTIFIAVN